MMLGADFIHQCCRELYGKGSMTLIMAIVTFYQDWSRLDMRYIEHADAFITQIINISVALCLNFTFCF
jgi:hypothetical protein